LNVPVFAYESAISNATILPSFKAEITELSINPAFVNAYSPQYVEFWVTVRNTGNLDINATPYVTVTDSGNNSIANVTFISMGIGAGLEAVFMNGSFYTANLSIGCYNAHVAASYSYLGNTEITSGVESSFCIQPSPLPPTQPFPDDDGISGSMVPPVPVGVNFVRTPVLIEVRPGETIITGIVVENDLRRNVSPYVAVSGIPKSWVDITPTVLTIPSGESRGLNVRLDIPSGAWPGDYEVEIRLSRDVYAKTFFFLRVKPYPSGYEKPAVTRVVQIDRNESKTFVSIKVENGGKFVAALEVVENVPKMLARTADRINFTAPSPEILEPDPVVKWVFEDLEPYETRRVSYEVPVVLDEYAPYVYWPIGQVNVFYIKKKDLAVPLRVQEISIPTLIPGRVGNVSVNVMNFEAVPLTVTAKFELPEGWSLYPSKITTTLPPRTRSILNFAVIPHPDASPGTYTVTFKMFYGTEEIERGSIAFIRRPLLDTLFRDIGRNLPVFAVIVFAALMAGIYRRRKRRERRERR